jgi:hypothetical protein
VKFKVLMQMSIEARTPQEAAAHAVKLKDLVKNPLVKMAIAGEGVTLADGDGQPVVFTPQPA